MTSCDLVDLVLKTGGPPGVPGAHPVTGMTWDETGGIRWKKKAVPTMGIPPFFAQNPAEIPVD